MCWKVISKKLGAIGADAAIKIGGRVGAGTLASAMRRTIGGGSAVASNWYAKNGPGGYEVRRMMSGVLNMPATKSFDLGAVSGKVGLDLGSANEGAKKGFRGVVEKISDAQIKFGNARTDADKAEYRALEAKKVKLESQERRMRLSGQNLTDPRQYAKVQADLAKVKTDMANTSVGRQNEITEKLNVARKDANSIAEALHKAKEDAEKMQENLTRASAAERSAAMANLDEATKKVRDLEAADQRARDAVGELEENLSEVRDVYARQLEGARQFWATVTPFNAVAGEALTRSRDTLLKYGRDPHARDHDEMHGLLHGILHAQESHGEGGHKEEHHEEEHHEAAKPHAPTKH